MLRDAQGLPVSSDAPAAVAAIDRFVDQFLGYGRDAAAILEGVEADPRAVLPNVLAGALHLFLESAAAPGLARPYLEAAAGSAATATRRERLWLAAVEAWAAGALDRAIALHRELAAEFPRDIAAVKLGQYHLFNRGDLAGMRALADAAFAANRDNAYMHGMLAFGLEQNHRLAEAEAAGRRAVEMRRREPWAHHAVAHVMETQGRVEEGIAWMRAHADSWDDCNSFMLSHNWWHLALFLIDRDDFAAALDLYDRRVWGVWKEYSQDQVNAASLLARLELRGVDVGDRWRDVAAHVAPRLREHVEPFLDLHYLYALARAGRDADVAEMLASLAAHARTVADFSRPAWSEVALSAAEGLVAHARGRHPAAFAALGRVRHRLQEIGGSHAQRDLFVQCWIDAGLKAGAAAALLPELRARAAARPNVAVTRRQLAAASAPQR